MNSQPPKTSSRMRLILHGLQFFANWHFEKKFTVNVFKEALKSLKTVSYAFKDTCSGPMLGMIDNIGWLGEKLVFIVHWCLVGT